MMRFILFVFTIFIFSQDGFSNGCERAFTIFLNITFCNRGIQRDISVCKTKSFQVNDMLKSVVYCTSSWTIRV